MFGKLKNKLKDALNVFSKDTQEAATEVVDTKEDVVEKVEEVKKEIIEKVDIKEEKEIKPVKEIQKVEEKKEKPQPKEIVEKPIKKEKTIIEKEKETPSAEELIEEVKEEEKVVKKEESKEKKEIETKEQKPTTTELLEEVEKEEITKKEEKPTKKSIFNIFKKKEKVTDDKVKEKKEEVIEKETEIKKEIEEPKKGIFGKVKQSFTTKTISENKFNDLFWNLELVLLENNVSVEVIEKIKEDLKSELVNKPLPRDVSKKIEQTLKNTLNEILSHQKIDLLKLSKDNNPLIIAFFGINGTGKTTSIAKLTHYFKQNNLSVVLAACDTFRAAAIQQLEEHANKLDVKIIKHDYGSDAAAVAFDTIKYAQKNKVDIVMIDTAGRLHSNTNLMDELKKIIKVTNPHLKIFVGESITGNDCIEQARKFNELVEMDGAILTKADVDEKGGAPLSISYTIKKPILFLGVGQNYEDIEVFDKEKIMQRLGF